jgi:hypothetical protein
VLFLPVQIVVTGAASAIGPTSATLNGTVNPNGLTTTAFFRTRQRITESSRLRKRLRR